jgi:hypothetical protein
MAQHANKLTRCHIDDSKVMKYVKCMYSLLDNANN